jgi:site-specific DNA-adenine methylase
VIKPPFNRQGNKYPIIDKLLQYIPPHQIYVEPFLGSGALFFNKMKAEYNILNDLDKYTIDGFKLLKLGSSNPNDYARDFSSIQKLKNLYNREPQTIEDAILKHKLISKGSFNGRTIKKADDIYIQTNPSSTFKNIAIYQDKLKNTTLLNRDYSFILKKYFLL